MIYTTITFLLATSFTTFCLAVRPPYGFLSVRGTRLTGESGQPVALHGMSLYWSQWSVGSLFYNAQTVRDLKCSWNSNVVRAAMAVEEGGYLTNAVAEMRKIETVINAAIAEGIYVIVDFHSHHAHQYTDKAIEFFTAISQKYGANPNILYEVFNEPADVSWNDVKLYHEKVTAAIRAHDTRNVIILGTPNWSQDVDVAAQNPVQGTNLMYTLHFYAGSHFQPLRSKASAALAKGLPIFVTEYGTVEANGGGRINVISTNEWWKFCDGNGISYANWAISNKNEPASALKPGTTNAQVGFDAMLTASGRLVKTKLKSQNNGVSC